MNEVTESQNIFLSAFGQIPDEFKPIVLLAVANSKICFFSPVSTPAPLLFYVPSSLLKEGLLLLRSNFRFHFWELPLIFKEHILK